MMEPGASKSAKEQLKMEMTIKTEVEAAATSTAHIDIKTDLNHLKQELVMVQSLNCEPALSVKEEILEDGCQGGNDQQCVQGTSTPAGTGSLNEACSLRDRLYKNELEELNIGPTVSRHMDIHYPIKKLNAHDAVTEESTTLDDCSEEMPCRGVKKESLEEKLRDGNEQQCVEGTITPADSGSRHEACGTSLGGFLHVKQDLDDMDIGPTVLQHMDIYNIINKNWSAIKEENTIVHDCNEVMPHHGVKKETAEDKLIDNQIKAYKGQTTTVVEYEVELTSCLSQQKELQQNILRQHQASSSNGFKCDSCNRIFHKPHLLSAHKKLHAHKEKPYQCTTCNARFAQRCALNGHMRVHTGQKPYQCTTCDARFAKNGHLTRHMRVHTGEKPYKCTTCDARFADSGTLTGHMRVHTGEKTYQCTTCDARFADSGALTKHTRVHSGEKPYQCTTCDARFAKKSSLSRHMRVHTGEKPYQCTTCDARFAQNNALTGHMRGHTGEKPYQCTTCDARFAQTSALTRHMRVHTGEKPYQCTTCDARFADSGTLIGHKRVHTGEKPYQCTTCDARFANSGALTKHSRVHTGEKP